MNEATVSHRLLENAVRRGAQKSLLDWRTAIWRSRALIEIVLLFIAASHSAYALDPSKQLSQYAHHAWTIRDGVFSGTVSAISQSVDGYLWVGTYSGLLRFDGVRFVNFEVATGHQLPNNTVVSLFSAKDGDLWIGTTSGLFRWGLRKLTESSKIHGVVTAIKEDHSGTLWISRIDSQSAEPVCAIKGKEETCFKRPDGVTGDAGCCEDVTEALDGTIWTGGRNLLMRQLKQDGFEAYPIDKLLARSPTDGISALVAGAGIDLWVGIHQPGRSLGLKRLSNDSLLDAKIPGFDASQLRIQRLFVDSVGTLWIGTDGQGVYRWTGDRVDHFDTHDGLSDDHVYAFFEDQEGTVWVGTQGGLDSFHEIVVTTYAAREGITDPLVSAVLAAADGGVRIGTNGGLYHLRGNALSSIREGNGLPGSQVTALLEDPSGRLWLGIDQTVWTYWQGRFSKIVRPDGTNLGIVNSLARDADGSVWATSIGPPRTLFRIRDQRVVEAYPAPTLPAIRRVAADPKGGIWLGLMSGAFGNFKNGSWLVIPSTLHPKRINDIVVGEDGAVLVATSDGLIRWQDGVAHELNDRVGLPCNDIYSVVTADGTLWIDSGCVILAIDESEIVRWWEHPESRISARHFDSLDGFVGPIYSFNPATKTPDGRIWFATGQVLQLIDPHHFPHNSKSPPVHVESLRADQRIFPLLAPVTLPPLTRTLEIDYTALSMAIPQRVRFRYRLEGHDVEWQDAGTRRQAFYNDIPPGHYRFHVIACNNDGVWNEDGDALEFYVSPAWYQTLWFRAALGVAVLMIFWSAYRLRLRQISTTLRLRFNERLDERTRLARDLHDTLLQTIQGSQMVADDALNSLDDVTKLRGSMEKLAGWLARGVAEGRAAVNALRYSRADTKNLSAALRVAVDDSLVDANMQGAVQTSGVVKDIQPIIRDEVYRIAFEAIRNACAHSGATTLSVTVIYGRDLVVQIRDNGRGIDAGVLELGKADHYGLSGMRERAKEIGALLRISSSVETGTEIVLTVPGSVAF
jgi:signal transduction histidine kinase/ligand-binding sensor domain-containing protein